MNIYYHSVRVVRAIRNALNATNTCRCNLSHKRAAKCIFV